MIYWPRLFHSVKSSLQQFINTVRYFLPNTYTVVQTPSPIAQGIRNYRIKATHINNIHIWKRMMLLHAEYTLVY